jgi:hypothetical protein
LAQNKVFENKENVKKMQFKLTIREMFSYLYNIIHMANFNLRYAPQNASFASSAVKKLGAGWAY